MRSRLRRVLVTGPSMAPAVRHGDQLLMWRVRSSYLPRPGTVVVVRLPDRPLSVKRVVRADPSSGVWVEGDNAADSTDSRHLGSLPPEAVVGRVVGRLWPRPGRLRTSP